MSFINIKKTIILYFKIVLIGKKHVDGYEYKEIGNLPIVGNHHHQGYEIVNKNTRNVVYRRVRDWGTIIGTYDPYSYTIKRKFFSKNI